MYTSCQNCKKLFQGEICGCGWKKAYIKPRKANEPKFDPTYEKRYYDRLEKKTGMGKIKKDAPRSEEGASKKDISSFWIEKIKKRIKNPKSE